MLEAEQGFPARRSGGANRAAPAAPATSGEASERSATNTASVASRWRQELSSVASDNQDENAATIKVRMRE